MHKSKKIIVLIIAMLIIVSSMILTYADDAVAQIEAKVDSWGDQFVKIGLIFMKWGGTFSFLGLMGYLFISNDEAGIKRAKWGVAITFIAAVVGWASQILGGIFK